MANAACDNRRFRAYDSPADALCSLESRRTLSEGDDGIYSAA